MMIVYDSIEVMDVISFIIRTRIGCTEMLYMHLGTTFFCFMLNVWDAHIRVILKFVIVVFGVEIDN